MFREIKEFIVFWLPAAVCVAMIGIVFMANAEANENEFDCTSVEDLCAWSPVDYWHLKGYELCAEATMPEPDSRQPEIYSL
ncbi:hypothetical protein ACLBW2_17315 [Enterobacteriaceae bacterium C23F]